MIKLENIFNDFETIAKEIETNTGKIVESEFIARLVICYTDKDKATKPNEYNKIQQITSQLNEIQIDYKAKENKYFYLLKTTDFENIDKFNSLKKLFNGGVKINDKGLKDFKILTINLNNITKYEKFIDLAIKALKNETTK